MQIKDISLNRFTHEASVTSDSEGYTYPKPPPMARGTGLATETNEELRSEAVVTGIALMLDPYDFHSRDVALQLGRGLLHPPRDYEMPRPCLTGLDNPMDAGGFARASDAQGLGVTLDRDFITTNLIDSGAQFQNVRSISPSNSGVAKLPPCSRSPIGSAGILAWSTSAASAWSSERCLGR